MEEMDPNLTVEGIEWLLAENVKAGTLALFWCLKSQLLKAKAKAFYRWQQRTQLMKFLSPHKMLRSLRREDGGGDYTEHMVTDTNERSQHKLLLSHRRDLLLRSNSSFPMNINTNSNQIKGSQSGRRSSSVGANQRYPSSTPIPDKYFQGPQTPHSNSLPSYMKPTVAVSSKYSTSRTFDTKVITSITRSNSTKKKAQLSRSISREREFRRKGEIEEGLNNVCSALFR